MNKTVFFRCLVLTISFVFLFPAVALAGGQAETPYQQLAAARAATHREGSFRLRGVETVAAIETTEEKITQSTRYYAVTGYDLARNETLLQLETLITDNTGELSPSPRAADPSFLIKQEGVYSKTSGPGASWAKQDTAALLSKMTTLGTMDIFLMLELLNSDRLPLYEPYLSDGGAAYLDGVECAVIQMKVGRPQFAGLAEALTEDVSALLGPAANGLTETQLLLLQTFARGILVNLDAEIQFSFYIDPETDRIRRIVSQTDMANPSGIRLPGTVSRLQTSAVVELYGFGEKAPTDAF